MIPQQSHEAGERDERRTTTDLPKPAPTPPRARPRAWRHTASAAASPAGDVQLDVMFCGICRTSDLHQVRNEWQSVTDRLPLRAGPRRSSAASQADTTYAASRKNDLAGRRLPGQLVSRARPASPGVRQLPAPCSPALPIRDRRRLRRLRGSLVVDRRSARKNLDQAGARAYHARASPPTRRCGSKEGGERAEGRHRGPRRPGPHGRQVRARLFGAHVVVLSTSPGKPRTPHGSARARDGDLARRRAMAKRAGSFDFILDTVSAPHDIDSLVHLLEPDSTLTMVRCARHADAAAHDGPDLRRRRIAELADRRHPRNRKCSASAASTASPRHRGDPGAADRHGLRADAARRRGTAS